MTPASLRVPQLFETLFPFPPLAALAVVALCALTAFVSHSAVSIMNDGVRPSGLDFVRGKRGREDLGRISYDLSKGFFFGVGVPLYFASGVLNPWLLLLPTDLLGIFSGRRWLAGLAGAAWGVVVVFGLGAARAVLEAAPVDFLGALPVILAPILFLFPFFPAVAMNNQFGRAWGMGTFALMAVLVVLTMHFLPGLYPGTIALLVGTLLVFGMALRRDLETRRAQPPEEREVLKAAVAEDFFVQNARRVRRNAPYFAAVGALVALLCNLGAYAGGEATSFAVAREDLALATQLDLYRAFGFVPLAATTGLGSGIYGPEGFNLVYPLGYSMPNAALAAVAGASLFAGEAFLLSRVVTTLYLLPAVRDACDQIRDANIVVLGPAMLLGSVLAGYELAGGLGVALVGGLYVMNEVGGRPVIRFAAGPLAFLIAGVSLNLLYYLGLLPSVGG